MRKIFLIVSFFLLFSYLASSYGQESLLVELEGISIGMNKKELMESWGYPSKRESKHREDIWYYLNENTPHPTDGILVYLYRGKVKNWKVVDNIYQQMNIWGRSVETSP